MLFCVTLDIVSGIYTYFLSFQGILKELPIKHNSKTNKHFDNLDTAAK